MYAQASSTSSPNRSRGLPTLAIRAIQILLGALFIFSGLMKSIDPMGTAIKLEEYLISFGLESFTWLTGTGAIALCTFETLLGFLLLSGAFRRTTATLTLVTLIGFTLLTLYIAITDPIPDCGCFGDAVKISNKATFYKNLLLLALAIGLRSRPGRMYSILPRSTHFIQLVVATLLIVHFNIAALMHLPVIDFRPFKVGAELPELTGRTQSIGTDEYDYRFVYSKDGKEQTFNLEQLSQVDSTWTFVRDESVELSTAKVATGTDFVIYRDGQNITDSLISPSTKVMLLLAPDVSKVPHDLADLFRDLSHLAKQHGGAIHLVIGNALRPDIDQWIAHINTLYPIDNMDRSTAKTIIRSNPGLVILNGGRIVRKSSSHDLKKLLASERFRQAPFEMTSRDERIRSLLVRFAPITLGTLLYLLATATYYTRACRRRKRMHLTTNNKID